jgi:hypothetical protein
VVAGDGTGEGVITVFDSGVGVDTKARVCEGVIVGIATELFPLPICQGGIFFCPRAALTFAPAE